MTLIDVAASLENNVRWAYSSPASGDATSAHGLQGFVCLCLVAPYYSKSMRDTGRVYADQNPGLTA